MAFFFEVLAWSGEIRNAEPDKCERLDWIASDSLPPNSVRYVRVALDHIRSGKRFSTLGWDEASAEEAVA